MYIHARSHECRVKAVAPSSFSLIKPTYRMLVLCFKRREITDDIVGLIFRNEKNVYSANGKNKHGGKFGTGLILFRER